MLALTLPPLFSDHLEWWIVGVIVVVGLLIIGVRDTIRFSISRAFAISGVCFSESIRKRVWWIPILAMLAVIIVTQLQKPFDEQDAIRQTTKFCLFASGLVVAITAIVLACTNLPKEIDNRVIYTIVTKPTTRLEIVLGKVMGFAWVSAAILILMGVFTFGYLHLRSWSLERDIAIRLDNGAVDPVSRPTLEHYRQAGLLGAKHLVEAGTWPIDQRSPVETGFQVFAKAPQANETVRWMSPGEQDFLVPFSFDPQDLSVGTTEAGQPATGGMIVVLKMPYTQRAPTTQEWETMPETRAAAAAAATRPASPTMGPQLPQFVRPLPATNASSHPATTPAMAAPPPVAPATAPPGDLRTPPPAQVVVNILDNYRNMMIDARQINGGKPIALPSIGESRAVQAYIPPEQTAIIANRLAQMPEDERRIFVQVSGVTPGVTYGAEAMPVRLAVPHGSNEPVKVIAPEHDRENHIMRPIFCGRLGTFGQQLKGASGDEAPVAVYSFRNAPLDRAASDTIPLEVRIGVERNSGNESDQDNPTQLAIDIHNLTSNQTTTLKTFTPETNRTSYLQVPRDAVAGGNFDVVVRCLSPDQWIGLRTDSIGLVPSQQPFAFNLGKSLLILWLMSILIIVISIFCSTFLSWPIAIVLTLVLLLGHWGVTQLGDATAPGIGNQVANDLGFRGATAAAQAKVVSSTVEALAKFLNVLSAVTPDVSRFAATEDLERGLVIQWQTIGEGLMVLLGFGVPLGVLAYVFLKYKEVAP